MVRSTPPARRRAPSLVLAAPLLLAACGGAPPPLPSAAATTAEDTRAIDARLQGNWRLVDYRPDVPLEPMFQLLLAQQVQSMIIHFEAGHLHGDSPTFHIDRAYQVTTAAGPYFKIASPDSGGSIVTTAATMAEDGSSIAFRAETDPWKGSGTLQRVP